MSEKLIEITRGKIVETIHRGDIVVVDNNNGKIIYSVGNTQKLTYMRSAAKPIQAINVLLSGAAQHYKFTNQELSIICSSHFGEDIHREAVNGILKKIGLTKNDILGGIVPSVVHKYALDTAYRQIPLDPLFSDCSGKHSGMLAVCRYKKYPIKDYMSFSNPCQKEIFDIFSDFTGTKKENIIISIDGCSAPVHGIPIYNMALGFANLANPENLNIKYQAHAKRIFEAMNQYPFMVSGTNGFCSELIKHTNNKLIGKIGAEGIYCIGIKNKNIGIAIKIESGSYSVLPPVAINVLKKLNILTKNELDNLKKYEIMDNLNDIETVVGEIKAIF